MKIKNGIPFVIFLWLSAISSAQDTIYLDNDCFKRLPPSMASYLEINSKETRGDTTSFFFETQTIEGVKTSSRTDIYIRTNQNKNQDSPSEFSISNNYYPNGQLQSIDTTVESKLQGTVLSYHPNGQLRRCDHYHDGELTEGRCFTPEGADTTWYIYREMPKYPGGEFARLKFLNKNIIYPVSARENEITGIVYLSFIIQKDGTIGPTKILKSPAKILSDEAVRVIKLMPRWEPGISEGKHCRTVISMPVRFTLFN